MEELYKLSEIADKKLASNETIDHSIISKIKSIVDSEGYIGLAQINPIAGNVEYNAKKIMKYLKYATSIGLDLIVFPELSLMGYPIEDTIDRHPIIVNDNIKWLKGIAKQTKKTTAIIGFVEPRANNAEGKKYYNSAAVIKDGKIQGIVRKSLLPNYSEFNDYRYMEPSPVSGIQPAETLGNFDKYSIRNCSKLFQNYGITICEDCWNNHEFFDKNLYNKDPIEEIAEEKPDIFINCSASPTRAKKEQLKHNMLSFISDKYKTPIVYVNQVGAIDNSSFDGSSRVFNAEGKLIARAKSFEEQLLIVNPLKNIGKIYPLTKGLEKSLVRVRLADMSQQTVAQVVETHGQEMLLVADDAGAFAKDSGLVLVELHILLVF